MQTGKPTFSVRADKIRGVLTILLISGYVQLPSRRMLWENSNDVHNPVVSFIMSVNWFEEILRYAFILLITKTFQLETRWQRFSHCIVCWTSGFCCSGYQNRIWTLTSQRFLIMGSTLLNSLLGENQSTSGSNCGVWTPVWVTLYSVNQWQIQGGWGRLLPPISLSNFSTSPLFSYTA